jgi:hypothetical protein
VFLALYESTFEKVTPNPEFLIKSISEQGYRLETAIADLIDNSISAGADKVEVLLNTKKSPFTLFVADNGSGMSEDELKSSMKFPSESMDVERGNSDLGRFGLGLKTASFSQTRQFTVLSRRRETDDFYGRTWDVALLREKGWVLKVENRQEVQDLLDEYKEVSAEHLAVFDENFEARTIVAWQGLYKFESHIEEHDCAKIVKSELAEITKSHLSLVFHRFMERVKNPLQIRLNNILLKPFNPFPVKGNGIRRLGLKNRLIGNDAIKVEGFVLPTKSIDEVRQGASKWVPQGKSLMDCEGIYIYRSDRIILFGGWLGLTSRSNRIQLGRMRVEIGNSADHLLHLNIAKSQVEMPHDLRAGFREYIAELKKESEREYFNRTVNRFQAGAHIKTESFISSNATNIGAQMSVNSSFPLVKDLNDTLDITQKIKLKTILRMVSTELNRIRRVHEDGVFHGVEGDDDLTTSELVEIIKNLLAQGFDSDFVRTQVLRELGYRLDTLPLDVLSLLE